MRVWWGVFCFCVCVLLC
uniref:Uncharacterized protein n=1 Tax=Anguilla anguilla TaxID=7936 RepID=A0A0E9U9D0_ANGAN